MPDCRFQVALNDVKLATKKTFLGPYRAKCPKPNIQALVMLQLTQGAWEVDQQWIISGLKQCSQHLKKIGLPISFFLEQTKKNIDQIPKNITHFIFGNEAPKAALSNYSTQYLTL